MTADKTDRAHQMTLRDLSEATGDRSAVWIDDETGQIIDSIPNESRTRPRTGCERYPITPSQQRRIGQLAMSINLVGSVQDRRHAVFAVAPYLKPMLPERRHALLLGKRGDS